MREWKKGEVLPVLKKRVTLEGIRRYAAVSGDLNPLHMDDAFAKKTAVGGIVAHGMLTLAYVSEMMTGLFGDDWLTGGSLDIRFKNPARPGDELTLGGEISGTVQRKNATTVDCDVYCHNQHLQPVMVGTCRVKISRKE